MTLRNASKIIAWHGHAHGCCTTAMHCLHIAATWLASLTGGGVCAPQLCMSAAVVTAQRGEHVVYVDTSNAFCPLRTLQLAQAWTEQVTVQHRQHSLQQPHHPWDITV
jgi:hypothetical protein